MTTTKADRTEAAKKAAATRERNQKRADVRGLREAREVLFQRRVTRGGK